MFVFLEPLLRPNQRPFPSPGKVISVSKSTLERLVRIEGTCLGDRDNLFHLFPVCLTFSAVSLGRVGPVYGAGLSE